MNISTHLLYIKTKVNEYQYENTPTRRIISRYEYVIAIFFIFLVLGSLSILFFKKRNKKELELSNRNTLIEAPSKEEIDMLLATCISYDFEPTEDFKDIPYRQVLYLEKTYNQDINSYIQANLGSIQKEYAKRSCDFIYLPYWLSNNNVQELVKYNAAQSLDSTINPSNITPHFTEKFFEWIKCQAPDIPIVISISRCPVDGHIRRFVAFPVNDADMNFFFQFMHISASIPKVRFTDLSQDHQKMRPWKLMNISVQRLSV